MASVWRRWRVIRPPLGSANRTARVEFRFPSRPFGDGLARVKFEIWTREQPLDAAACTASGFLLCSPTGAITI